MSLTPIGRLVVCVLLGLISSTSQFPRTHLNDRVVEKKLNADSEALMNNGLKSGWLSLTRGIFINRGRLQNDKESYISPGSNDDAPRLYYRGNGPNDGISMTHSVKNGASESRLCFKDDKIVNTKDQRMENQKKHWKVAKIGRDNEFVRMDKNTRKKQPESKAFKVTPETLRYQKKIGEIPLSPLRETAEKLRSQDYRTASFVKPKSQFSQVKIFPLEVSQSKKDFPEEVRYNGFQLGVRRNEFTPKDGQRSRIPVNVPVGLLDNSRKNEAQLKKLAQNGKHVERQNFQQTSTTRKNFFRMSLNDQSLCENTTKEKLNPVTLSAIQDGSPTFRLEFNDTSSDRNAGFGDGLNATGAYDWVAEDFPVTVGAVASSIREKDAHLMTGSSNVGLESSEFSIDSSAANSSSRKAVIARRGIAEFRTCEFSGQKTPSKWSNAVSKQSLDEFRNKSSSSENEYGPCALVNFNLRRDHALYEKGKTHILRKITDQVPVANRKSSSKRLNEDKEDSVFFNRLQSNDNAFPQLNPQEGGELGRKESQMGKSEETLEYLKRRFHKGRASQHVKGEVLGEPVSRKNSVKVSKDQFGGQSHDKQSKAKWSYDLTNP